MNLATLKTTCATLLDRAVSDLTQNSVDLFLVAANNARKNAELRHNFEYARCTSTLSLDGVSGAPLDGVVIDQNGITIPTQVTVTGSLSPDATGVYNSGFGSFNGQLIYVRSDNAFYLIYVITPFVGWVIVSSANYPSGATAGWKFVMSLVLGSYVPFGSAYTGVAVVASSAQTFSKIKEVVAVMRQRPDGTWIPLDFARVDIPIERDRTELEFSDNLFPYLRYPSDAQINARGTNSSIVQRGRSLYIHPRFNQIPSTTYSIQVEGYGWLSDYVAVGLTTDLPKDFIVEYGFSFLQWSIILELNTLFKQYVARQEGNLSPNDIMKMRDDAWHDLLLWDTYQVDANTTRSR